MLESLNVAAIYAASLATIGAPTAIWLLRGTPGAREDRIGAASALLQLTRIALVSALGLWVLLLVRVVTHSIAVFDLPDALTPASLWTIAVESRWGGGWRVQMLVSSACVGAAVWHLRSEAFAARPLMSIAAAGIAFALPLSGHSAGSAVHLGIAAAHVMAAGAWLGTLGVLVMARRSSRNRPGTAAAGTAVFNRFSPVAMCGAATVVGSGLWMVWLYLGPLRAVLESGYGRLLAVKLVLFAAVCACGYLNWRRARRGEPLPAATWEVALTLAIVLVTGFLTESAPP